MNKWELFEIDYAFIHNSIIYVHVLPKYHIISLQFAGNHICGCRSR